MSQTANQPPVPYGHATMTTDAFDFLSKEWPSIRFGENYDRVEYLNSPHGLIVLAHQNTEDAQVDGIHPSNLSDSILNARNIVEPLKDSDGALFSSALGKFSAHWMTRRSQGALILSAFGRMIDGDDPEAVMLVSSEAMTLEIFNAPVGPIVALFDSFSNDVHVIWPGLSGDVGFIQEGQTKSCGPEFVSMTPEDEASIRGA
ncbi:hypothetical protein AB1J06_13085 [Agrobacterium tumefaciens]|uniref:hypothetical protein n=1 Tax=Agrobacterium tumefaciens TaxID=358 RepID=UPI003457C715